MPSVPAKTETVKTIMLTRDGDIAEVEEEADLLDAKTPQTLWAIKREP